MKHSPVRVRRLTSGSRSNGSSFRAPVRKGMGRRRSSDMGLATANSAETPAEDGQEEGPGVTLYTVASSLEVDHSGTGMLIDTHAAEVFCVSYIGNVLASSALDGSIAIRDARTHKLLSMSSRADANAHKDGVFQVAGARNRLYSICWDGALKVWGLPTLELLSETMPHPRSDPSARYGGFSVAVTPRGEHIATGGGDGDQTIKLWTPDESDDAEPGHLVLVASAAGAHEGVNHLEFAPGGHAMASVGSEACIKLWAVPSLEELAFRDDAGSNKHAVFSPRGDVLASCGSDQAIRLWEVPSLELHAMRHGAHDGEIRRLAYSPDGATIASCALDSTVRLWASSSLTPMGRLDGAHSGNIFSVVFPPQDGGRTLTTCGADRAIKRWATPTLSMESGLPPGTLAKQCVGVGFMPDATAIVAVSGNLAIEMFALPRFERLFTTRGTSDGEARCACFSADGKLLAMHAGRWGRMQLWRIERWPTPRVTYVDEFQTHMTRSHAVCFAPRVKRDIETSEATSRLNTSTAVSLAASPMKRQLRPSAEQRNARSSMERSAGPTAAAAAALGVAKQPGLMVLGSPVRMTADRPPPAAGGGSSLQHAPLEVQSEEEALGWELATGSEDGSVRVWYCPSDTSELTLLGERREAHGGDYVANVAYHPAGHMLASESVFSEIKLWSVRRVYADDFSSEPVRVRLSQLFALPRAHPRDTAAHALSGLAFSPDGASLASSGDVLRVWAVQAGALEFRQEMELGARSCVIYSHDGFELALGGEDGSIRIYWAMHLPPSTTSPFARALHALEEDDADALRELPTASYGLRDIRRGRTFGWTLLHHACALTKPRALGVLLEGSPGVLIDALAPPFHNVRLEGSRLVALPAVDADEADGAAGAAARRDSVLRGDEPPLVPSVLDVALGVKSSADAKACIADILGALVELMREDAANVSAFVRTPSGRRLQEGLLRIGHRYADLLAAVLPALDMMHQPSGVCAVNLVGSERLYTAFAHESTPFGLARELGEQERWGRVLTGGSGRASAVRPAGRGFSISYDEAVTGIVDFWTRERKLERAPSATSSAGAITSTYTSCVVPLTGDLVSFLEQLDKLNGRRTRTNLYDNMAVVAIVHALWTHGAGQIHALMCVTFVLLVAVLTIFALSPGSLSEWVLLACSAPHIIIEAGTLLTTRSPRAYLRSPYNWADWLNYGLLLLVGLANDVVADDDTRRCLFATLIVLVSFKLLFWLRAYTTLVSTVLQAVRDMGAFALIVVLMLVPFALARMVLTFMEREETPHALLETFALMLGAFDLAEFAVDVRVATPRQYALQVLFYAFQILVTIVLLNLLITILSDSHDLSTERRKAEYMRMRAQLIVEYHRLIPAILRPRGEWLHVLVSSAMLAEQRRDFEIDVASNEDEWSTRLTSLRSQLGTVRREGLESTARLDAKIEACSTRIEQVGQKVDSVLSGIQGLIASTNAVVGEQGLLGERAPRARRRSVQINSPNPLRARDLPTVERFNFKPPAPERDFKPPRQPTP